MNIEDLISKYIDGDLSSEAEAELHHRLAVSPEARQLFRAQIALRSVARDLRVQHVPTEVMRAGLFERLQREEGANFPAPEPSPAAVSSQPPRSIPSPTLQGERKVRRRRAAIGWLVLPLLLLAVLISDQFMSPDAGPTTDIAKVEKSSSKESAPSIARNEGGEANPSAPPASASDADVSSAANETLMTSPAAPDVVRHRTYSAPRHSRRSSSSRSGAASNRRDASVESDYRGDDSPALATAEQIGRDDDAPKKNVTESASGTLAHSSETSASQETSAETQPPALKPDESIASAKDEGRASSDGSAAMAFDDGRGPDSDMKAVDEVGNEGVVPSENFGRQMGERPSTETIASADEDISIPTPDDVTLLGKDAPPPPPAGIVAAAPTDTETKAYGGVQYQDSLDMVPPSNERSGGGPKLKSPIVAKPDNAKGRESDSMTMASTLALGLDRKDSEKPSSKEQTAATLAVGKSGNVNSASADAKPRADSTRDALSARGESTRDIVANRESGGEDSPLEVSTSRGNRLLIGIQPLSTLALESGGTIGVGIALKAGLEIVGDHQIYLLFGGSGYHETVTDSVISAQRGGITITDPAGQLGLVPSSRSESRNELWGTVGYRFTKPLGRDLGIGIGVWGGVGTRYLRYGLDVPVSYSLTDQLRLEFIPRIQSLRAHGEVETVSRSSSSSAPGDSEERKETIRLMREMGWEAGFGIGILYLW